MPATSSSKSSKSSVTLSEPGIFSRGSLTFTFELLRKKNPQLALTIRNIVHGKPLKKKRKNLNNKNSDHFKVELDSFEVRSVVEGLMAQDTPAPNSDNMGKVIMAKALIDEWMKLARKMIEELPEDQRPPNTL